MYKNSIIWSAEMRGREKGREEGEKIGIEKGKKEEKIEIARNLLKQNIDIDVITISTGLSKKEIEELKKR